MHSPNPKAIMQSPTPKTQESSDLPSSVLAQKQTLESPISLKQS